MKHFKSLEPGILMAVALRAKQCQRQGAFGDRDHAVAGTVQTAQTQRCPKPRTSDDCRTGGCIRGGARRKNSWLPLRRGPIDAVLVAELAARDDDCPGYRKR